MEFFPSPPAVCLHRQALSATQSEERLTEMEKGDIPDVTDGKQGEVEANSVGLFKYIPPKRVMKDVVVHAEF
jgi:hypothetical protein